ncbi:MAG: YqgE/AlgH family protein [Sphingomonadales bacterium]
MTKTPYLTGHFLLAMPSIADPRFERSVVYMCMHSEEGAMGLIVNRMHPGLDFEQLLEQLDIEVDAISRNVPIHQGGPVEVGRGFVLHSADYVQESTMIVSETVAMTATVDILRELARGGGPRNALLALGYAGWSAGQLDAEIQRNGWLTVAADDEILFHTDAEQKWPRAMAMLGVDISMLSSESGHA